MRLNVGLPGPFSVSVPVGGRGSSGCLPLFAVFAILVYAFTYWWVVAIVVALTAMVAVAYRVATADQREQAADAAEEAARETELAELAEHHRALTELMESVTTMPIPIEKRR